MLRQVREPWDLVRVLEVARAHLQRGGRLADVETGGGRQSESRAARTAAEAEEAPVAVARVLRVDKVWHLLDVAIAHQQDAHAVGCLDPAVRALVH
eukprot:1492283-Prymnesium_polylepis.2